MLVFVDESGDPGFKIARGSSKIFVISMVIFDNIAQSVEATTTIKGLLLSTGVKPEFKFSKCSDEVKDIFFAEIAKVQFVSRIIVVDKESIRSNGLRTVKENFYKFFIRQVIEHDGGMLKNAKLIIDGSGDRVFKKEFCAYLKKRISSEAIRKVSLKDSKSEPLLQLADMVAGAVARSYRKDREQPSRWRDMLAKSGKLQNVWHFR